MTMTLLMQGIDPVIWFLIAAGAMVMAMVLLRGIGEGAVQVASVMCVERRNRLEQEKADNAAAEAAGKAAGMEPLALNPDGSIEEPIIGVVETR
jgi:hypothetical protein